jgi:hypothetical protein
VTCSCECSDEPSGSGVRVSQLIHKLINSTISSKEELPDQWNELTVLHIYNKIGKVYSLDPSEILKVFFTPQYR